MAFTSRTSARMVMDKEYHYSLRGVRYYLRSYSSTPYVVRFRCACGKEFMKQSELRSHIRELDDAEMQEHLMISWMGM